MRIRALLLCALTCLMATAAQAQGFWLPAGDQRLRDDVALLADEGVIRLPTGEWPIPAADVRAGLERVDVDALHESALQAAVLRVRDRVTVRADAGEWSLHEVSVTAGRAGLLRSYEQLGRETGEVTTTGGTGNDRWSLNIAATGALSASDGKSLRLDGSDLTVRWGNWLFSANTLPRWFGPGQEGSLILSTNARPIPSLSLDRMRSVRSSVPILSWIGPWRFSALMGRTEGGRPDVNHALFLGMRFSFQPLQVLEFGLSRTAQFCGDDRICGLGTIGRVILGKDNVGLRVEPGKEPGNQMAGADFRIVSPLRSLPFALYGQLIGEDGSSSSIPERYLGLFGLQTWTMLESGSTLRAQIEYSNTNCKFQHPAGSENCAYNQAIFFAGYRYRGRNIGHTTDGDSEFVTASLRLTQSDGEVWGLRLRQGTLDQRGGVSVYNPITRGRSDYTSGELSWRGELYGQDLAVQVGFERQDAAGRIRDDGAFGFVQWRKRL